MVNSAFLDDLARRGWTYVERPSLDAVAGLNCPPFGQGYQRLVIDQVLGTSGLGVPFQALRYGKDKSTEYARVVLLRLRQPMPPVFISLPAHPRPGIQGLSIPNRAGLLVVSPVPEFAEALLEVTLPLLVRWAKQYPINLSIDGDSLVSTGAPIAPDRLNAYVEELDDIAAAINSAPSLRPYTATKPKGMSFYQRPSWVYRERDDSILAGALLTTVGTGHRAVHVVDIPERGLWFTGFLHAYETTGSTTDGYSSTTTNEDPTGQILLPFRFGSIANGWRGFGDRLAFFGEGISDYNFSSPDPAFATAVVESTRSFLATAYLPKFAIEGSRVHMRAASSDPSEYERLAWTFAEWFSLIPDKIWQQYGLQSSPVPRSLR